MEKMRRTVRTRGARASYCGPPSCSYSGLTHSDTISLQQLESILAQNVANYDQDNMQGFFTNHDGTSAQNCNSSTATEEEIAMCLAKVDEMNLERLRLTYPQIQHNKITQLYELCEKNLIRTIDNINFYNHINLAIQNVFRNTRSSAFQNWKPKQQCLEDFEEFATAFVNSSQPNVDNTASDCQEEPIPGPSHFEC